MTTTPITRRKRTTIAGMRLYLNEENSVPKREISSTSFWHPQPTEQEFSGTNSSAEEVIPGMEQVRIIYI